MAGAPMAGGGGARHRSAAFDGEDSRLLPRSGHDWLKTQEDDEHMREGCPEDLKWT